MFNLPFDKDTDKKEIPFADLDGAKEWGKQKKDEFESILADADVGVDLLDDMLRFKDRLQGGDLDPDKAEELVATWHNKMTALSVAMMIYNIDRMIEVYAEVYAKGNEDAKRKTAVACNATPEILKETINRILKSEEAGKKICRHPDIMREFALSSNEELIDRLVASLLERVMDGEIELEDIPDILSEFIDVDASDIDEDDIDDFLDVNPNKPTNHE